MVGKITDKVISRSDVDHAGGRSLFLKLLRDALSNTMRAARHDGGFSLKQQAHRIIPRSIIHRRLPLPH